jgi:hypothetical protein
MLTHKSVISTLMCMCGDDTLMCMCGDDTLMCMCGDDTLMCEHILPVQRLIFFLNLWQNRKIGKPNNLKFWEQSKVSINDPSALHNEDSLN